MKSNKYDWNWVYHSIKLSSLKTPSLRLTSLQEVWETEQWDVLQMFCRYFDILHFKNATSASQCTFVLQLNMKTEGNTPLIPPPSKPAPPPSGYPDMVLWRGCCHGKVWVTERVMFSVHTHNPFEVNPRNVTWKKGARDWLCRARAERKNTFFLLLLLWEGDHRRG